MIPEALQKQVENQIMDSYESMYRLAYTYVKNQDDAMDVVQESVYKAITNAKSLQSEDALKSWLCRIVVNTALDFLRKNKRETAPGTLPDAGREDTYRDLDTLRALEALNEKERTVIVLRFFQDLKLQDVAEITGDNLSTVKTILYRSLKKMRIQLTEGVSAS